MSIVRVRRGHYTSISRSLLQDKSLSYETRGMLTYLLSHSDDWECRIRDIEKNGGIGKFARRRIMKEAELAGYLTFTKSRGKDGRFVSSYMVFDEPVSVQDRTRSWEMGGDDPDLDEPDTNEPDTDTPQADCPPPVLSPPVNQGLYSNSDLHNSDLHKRERERESLSPDDTPVSIYQEVFGEGVPIFQQEALEAANISDMKLWREVVTAWRTNGYSKRNFTGLINSYQERTNRQAKGTDYETKRKQAAEYCHKLVTNPIDIPSERESSIGRGNVWKGNPSERPDQFIKPRTFADVFEDARRARDGQPSESVV